MITTKRTNSEDEDFKALVKLLDEELKILDGEEHLFYAQLNKIENIKQVIVLYDGEENVGCGAIREYAENTMEVKRMYVLPGKRGRGIASAILKGLEDWSKELEITTLVLETGKKQPEAIALYKKSGYHIIPSYGKYKNMENSICFKKELNG
ncbi:MAG: GNAT family N-acetyltransferase [Ferruginibacter sp.]